MIANLDKKEFLNPHKLASGVKFWEILASESATRALAFMLRQSNEGGGGDPEFSNQDDKKYFCGRWRGDRIAIVGDYDETHIYQKCTDLAGMKSHNKWVTENDRLDEVLKSSDLFKDITDKMLKEYNKFIDIPELQVDLESEGWRQNKKPNEKPQSSPDMVLSSKGMTMNPKI